MGKNSPEYDESEWPAIQQFQQMGYQYYNGGQTDERTHHDEVVLENRLRIALRKLNPWINDANLNKAYHEITNVMGNSLMEINQKTWEYLRGDVYTLKQEINGSDEFNAVRYIDYTTPANNDWLVVNQMRFQGKAQNSVPDLVVFVNGLPLAVIECKAPTAQNAFDKAYSDLAYYQSNTEKLFYYNQLCVGLWGDGGRYGAIGSPSAFYSVYRTRPDDGLPAHLTNAQAQLLYVLFEPTRLLDMVRHFVLFEREDRQMIKKLPRHQQLRATNKTIAQLQQNQGGVVWHTQGSGKSLTMAYLARKLQAPEYGFKNPTIMVLTDRKDLDRQITNTFRNVGFKNVDHAHSVKGLQQLLNNNYGGIITTTLQKFQEAETDLNDSNAPKTTDQTELEERGNLKIEKRLEGSTLIKITKAWDKDQGKWEEVSQTRIALQKLSDKENLYVLVDEAHRSQYGFLAAFMRTAMPHAKFVAFTGTPISKADKSTLGEFYGGDYLDVYTITEAVADGATVELLYDQGIALLSVHKEALDAEFEEKFGHQSAEKKERLKQDALREYQRSEARIQAIAEHILAHFANKIFPDGHKAMLVCAGREMAINYQKVLTKLKEEGGHNFESKVVVSLGGAKDDAIAREYHETLAWNQANPDAPRPVWVVDSNEVKTITENFKLPYPPAGESEEDTHPSGSKKYDNTAILIVSDMLLTGYDAPIASCLYLDKPLKEHNLLQAIARVNRSGKGKNAGFIVDYQGIADNLQQALEIFSGDIRPEDIMKNLAEEIPRLEQHHALLVDFSKPVKVDRQYQRGEFIEKMLQFLAPVDKRDTFKSLLKKFNKSINLVLPNEKALAYEYDFTLFNEIKLRARNVFPEDEDLKTTTEESQMLRAMIDEHLEAEGVKNLLAEPVSIIDKDKFTEEMMKASPTTNELFLQNNLKHTIKVGKDKNPDFYKPLGDRLDELLRLRHEERLSQTDMLKAFADIQEAIRAEQKEGEARGFVTERERALYNTMKVIFGEEAEAVTHDVLKKINDELSITDWQNKDRVQKDIENKLLRYLLTKMDRPEAKAKARDIVKVLKKNSG